MEDEIEHFSHKHRLKLSYSSLKPYYRHCRACLDYVVGECYCCSDCSYYLHEECAKLDDLIKHLHQPLHSLKPHGSADDGCAKLEDEIKHSHQPFHSLKLHGSANEYGRDFNFSSFAKKKGDFDYVCGVCGRICLGFFYRCTDCDFIVDVGCAPKTKIRLPFHDHDLKLQVSDTETEQSFFCDFCRTRCSHRVPGFHCKDCNFKIDLDCAGMLKSKYIPIQHVSHEHWLIYGDSIEAGDRKYCAACRKVCDGATYCCKPCYFFLHGSCALYRTEIELPLHSFHSLKLGTRKGRERCDFCNLICQDITFRCDSRVCDFKIDYLCARMLIELPVPRKIDHFSHPHSLSVKSDYGLHSHKVGSRTVNANCYECRKRLHNYGHSTFYECSDCAFYLHESCCLNLIQHYRDRDYKHILNSFHNHQLEIVYYHGEVPGFVCCTLCHKCCFGPTYVCFLCKLFLHESCLKLLGTNTISQNSFHKHPLITAENKVSDSTSSFFVNNDFPSCSACGEPCFGKSFACLKCKFLIHELCLQLPHEIQHFFHPCPLSLRQESTNFTCRACEKSHSQFAYHCNRCHFYLDVQCAQMLTRNFEGQNSILCYYHHHPLLLCNKESNDHVVSCDGCNQVISGEIYGCIQCHFYLHRSCAAAPHQIEHPFHPKHTLTLFFDEKMLCTVSILKSLDKKGKVKYLRHKHFSIHDDKKNEVSCGVCEKHVCGPSYECIRCKFFIHQDCIEPVEEVQHPFQPHVNDSLIGVSRKTPPRKKFTCDACSCQSCFGFSYRCTLEECRFKLDVSCPSLKPSIKYKGHKHLLTFFEKVYDDPQCEVCKSCYPDVSYLRCVECDFNVHLFCAPLPTTIKHKCHIDPLYLVDYFVDDDYVVEDDSGEYYCDACENSRDLRECVYRCEGCANYVAHINCVIDEVLLLLSGRRGNVELRSVNREKVNKLLKIRLTLEYIFSFLNEEEKKEFVGFEAAVGDLILKIMSRDEFRNMEDIQGNSYSEEIFIFFLKNFKVYAKDLQMTLKEYKHTESVKDYIHELENAKLDVRDSGMTFWDLESEVVKLGDYKVSRNFAPILKSIFEKYGDISANSSLNPRTKTRFINIFGGVAHSMCNTEVTTDLLFNWWKNFKLVQHAGFNIQFAFDNLYKLAQSWFCLHREFLTNETLLNYHVQIRGLKTNFEELKAKQKQSVAFIKRKSLAEKERLIADIELISNTPRTCFICDIKAG